MTIPVPAPEGAGPATVEVPVRKEPDVTGRDKPIPESPRLRTEAKPDQAAPKWVALPNTGKISEGAGGRSDAFGGAEAGPRRDRGAHADRAVRFEAESTRSLTGPFSGDLAGQSGAPPASRSTVIGSPTFGSRLPNQPGASVESKVQAVPHVVERGENFWTISRLYYSNERYYKALWKANARKHPKIDELYVNDVIIVPPVEDLDPAYIDPPRVRTARAGVEGTRRGATAGSPSPSVVRRDPNSTARTARASKSVPKPSMAEDRSNRKDAVLNLPIGETIVPRDRGRGIAVAEATGEEADESVPESRTAARPRIAATVNRPTYKVRRYDTLRSIARDALGDSRRDREILSLNRDIIDDPTNLIPGQLLELPEDADTRRITARNRN